MKTEVANQHVMLLASEVGGSETNREIVSFRFVRSCVRARGLVVEWNLGSIPGL